MILLIDNYDSFVYNLYQIIGQCNSDIKVVRNDELEIEDIRNMSPTHIVLSPGPGKPSDAGICEKIVKKLGSSIPILGVCLGHQAICEVYGATVTYAPTLMHGKQSLVKVDTNSVLYRDMPDEMRVARYHSLAVGKVTIPDELKITGMSDDGEVMSIEHSKYPVYGVQYHPESILTPQGKQIIKNFLNITCKVNDMDGFDGI